MFTCSSFNSFFFLRQGRKCTTPSSLGPTPKPIVCSWAGGVVSFSSMFRQLTNPHPGHLPGCCSGIDSSLIPPILLYHCAGQSHPAHFSPRLQVLPPLTTGHLGLSSSCACTSLSNPSLVLANPDPWPSILPGLSISDCWHFILCTIHHLLAQSTGLKAKVTSLTITWPYHCWPDPTVQASLPFLGLSSSRTTALNAIRSLCPTLQV